MAHWNPNVFSFGTTFGSLDVFTDATDRQRAYSSGFRSCKKMIFWTCPRDSELTYFRCILVVDRPGSEYSRKCRNTRISLDHWEDFSSSDGGIHRNVRGFLQS